MPGRGGRGAPRAGAAGGGRPGARGPARPQRRATGGWHTLADRGRGRARSPRRPASRPRTMVARPGRHRRRRSPRGVPRGRARPARAPGARRRTEPDPEVPDLSGPGVRRDPLHPARRWPRACGDGAAAKRPRTSLAWALDREGRYWRATATASRRRRWRPTAPCWSARWPWRRSRWRTREDAAAAALRRDSGPRRRARATGAPWLAGCAISVPARRGRQLAAGARPDELGDALVAAVLAESPSHRRAGCWTTRAPSRPESVLRAPIAPRAATRACERCSRRARARAAARAVAGGARRRPAVGRRPGQPCSAGAGPAQADPGPRGRDPRRRSRVGHGGPARARGGRGGSAVAEQRREAGASPAADAGPAALAEATFTAHAIRLSAARGASRRRSSAARAGGAPPPRARERRTRRTGPAGSRARSRGLANRHALGRSLSRPPLRRRHAEAVDLLRAFSDDSPRRAAPSSGGR